MTPFVLGIAGGSASGKTWLSRALADMPELSSTIVSHDSYYRPLDAARRAQAADHNFDEPAALESDLLAAHLTQLRAGNTVHVPVYDFATHDRIRHRPVEPAPLIVVEGILLFAEPALRDLMDLRVFVRAPEAVRRARRVARDVAERGRERTWVEARFDRHVQPMHAKHVAPSAEHADLIVDGQTDVHDNARRVWARVRATMRS